MPAYGNFILDKGYDLDAAVTKYRAVKAGTGVESVTPVTVLGEFGIGIAQFDATTADIADGKGASVREAGISEWEVISAGTIARDAEVTCNTDGTCKAAVTGNVVWGRARQAITAAVAGSRIAVDLAPRGAKYTKP